MVKSMNLKNNHEYYDVKNVNNLFEIIEEKKNKMPKKVAFSYREDGVIINKTYGEVYNEIMALSAYLAKSNSNKHIAIIGENSYNWLIFFMAIILSGNVAVIIDKDSDKSKVNKLLRLSDCKTICFSNKYCSFIKEILFMKTYKLEDLDKYITKGKMITGFKVEAQDDKDAAIFFTSGTTGPNKAVVLSQKNMAFDIVGASSCYDPYGPVVDYLPFHHAFGLITAVLMAYNYGMPVLISNSLKNIMKDLKDYRPQTIFAVPLFIETFYKQIWKSARSSHKQMLLKLTIKMSNGLMKIGIDKRRKLFKSILNSFGGNLDTIICGGAYLDKFYIKWFRSIGINILNGYGITECGPVVSVNQVDNYKDGSVGIPCKGVEVKVIDGELCVKGDNVMKGYYKDPKGNAAVLKDGYFHTGDLGYIDDDGFVFITGRKKNLIILSNGENISPETIENVLQKDSAVCEVVVYPKDNKIVAIIFPNEDYIGNQEYFDELIYKYNKDKPKNNQIAYVELRSEEFPKNSSKKIVRDLIGKEKNK